MFEIKKLFSEEQIARRVKELANQIEKDMDNEEFVLVANLKGSFIFFSDLIRSMERQDIEIDFVSTESYEGESSSGVIKMTRDLSLDIRDKKVILVEDIVDTGLTLSHLIHYIKEAHQPKEMRFCVLLDKPSKRKTDVKMDYVGFTVEDYFVIGYGLDYQEKFRNLPYIGFLTGEYKE
jgi:hypoxanthine phosphoribosyltransferase